MKGILRQSNDAHNESALESPTYLAFSLHKREYDMKFYAIGVIQQSSSL